MWQILLQNATAILLQNTTEIYYKMHQVFITKYVGFITIFFFFFFFACSVYLVYLSGCVVALQHCKTILGGQNKR